MLFFKLLEQRRRPNMTPTPSNEPPQVEIEVVSPPVLVDPQPAEPERPAAEPPEPRVSPYVALAPKPGSPFADVPPRENRAVDGGAAFPRPGYFTEFANGFDCRPEPGMSLRDWIAARLFVAMVETVHHGRFTALAPEYAGEAFDIADLFIAERNRRAAVGGGDNDEDKDVHGGEG